MRSRLALILGVLTLAIGILLGGALGGVLAQDGEATPEAGPAGEIVVDGQRYTFDREVTIDLGQLQELADEAGNPVFVKTQPDPLAAVYTPAGETMRRYLPQYLDAP
ncbi:MAG TPA: hypothetical protein VD789_11490, partial [Thermomicrobiales bacterium]|nr:hypothetical protein [Thermomicrobiales bacterium]